MQKKSMIRFGLCCCFRAAPIHFRTTTATYAKKLKHPQEYFCELILHNITALREAIEYCAQRGIGSFRITSRFFPLATHPDFAYSISELPLRIKKALGECNKLAAKLHIRLTFHPDQFVVLNSPSEKVIDNAICELEYQGSLANLLGADVIILHGGGRYGDKKAALSRLKRNLKRLSRNVLSRLAIENDDVNFTPEDLLPICRKRHLPLVYDVHHHRILSDSLSLEDATKAALSTWGKKEPLFHISSPARGKKSRHHADYISPADFPAVWLTIPRLTVEVEAKAKELAVQKLIQDIYSK